MVLFNYDSLKDFINQKQNKENIALKDILKPLHISEKRFNKILNNESYFTINEIFNISKELNISNEEIAQVFFNTTEV